MAASETKPKQYQSRHRLRWAARFPLRPGRDLHTRRAILLQVADTAVSGKYWETQEHLAAKVGLTVRGVQKALDKLCAEGVLSRQTRGYKRTTVYTLLRLDEVVEYGDFLPAGEPERPAQQRFPRTGAQSVETNSKSSYYIVRTQDPGQGVEDGLETNRKQVSERFETNSRVRTRKEKREEGKKYRNPNGLLDAPANGASRLPSASTQTPSSFSSTEEEDTHPEGHSPEPTPKRFPRTGKQAEVQTNGATAPSVRTNGNHPSKGRHCMDDFDAAYEQYRKRPPISRDAASLDSYLRGGTGRPLPGAWLRYPDLGRQMDRLGFIEVGSVLSELARQTGGHLPEPEKFFGAYGQYRQIHLARSRPRNGRRRAA